MKDVPKKHRRRKNPLANGELSLPLRDEVAIRAAAAAMTQILRPTEVKIVVRCPKCGDERTMSLCDFLHGPDENPPDKRQA